jgi:hypothetical protein
MNDPLPDDGAARPRRRGMTRASRIALSTAVAGGIVAGAVTLTAGGHHEELAGNVSAAAPAKAAGNPCVGQRFSKYRKYIGTTKVWPNTSYYRASGWGPHSTLRLDKQVSVANKVSATFGASAGGISATVGFDVTKTRTTTFSYAAELKKKAHYTLRAGLVYKVYAFNVYERRGEYRPGVRGIAYCSLNKNVWVGTGKASNFWTFDFRLTKGRKA